MSADMLRSPVKGPAWTRIAACTRINRGLLAMPRSGRRLIFGSFQAGQVGMLDITNPNQFKQVSVVNFGLNAGPHSIHLTHDDKRLVVTDYFLDEDGFVRLLEDGPPA